MSHIHEVEVHGDEQGKKYLEDDLNSEGFKRLIRSIGPGQTGHFIDTHQVKFDLIADKEGKSFDVKKHY